jgi:hypothetical protein
MTFSTRGCKLLAMFFLKWTTFACPILGFAGCMLMIPMAPFPYSPDSIYPLLRNASIGFLASGCLTGLTYLTRAKDREQRIVVAFPLSISIALLLMAFCVNL